MEFRTLREEELEKWFDHCMYVFNEGAYDEIFRNRFVRHYHDDPYRNLNAIFVAVDEGKIVSTVRVFERDVMMDDTILRMGGIGEVSTRREYRGQGLATTLMKNALSFMEKNEIHLSYLGTGVQQFYERFGWHSIPLHFSHYECDGVNNITPIQPTSIENVISIIAPLYEQSVQANGTVHRSVEYWKQWIVAEQPTCWLFEEQAYILTETKEDALLVKECGGELSEEQWRAWLQQISEATQTATIIAPACIDLPLQPIKEEVKGDWMIRLNTPVSIGETSISTTEELLHYLHTNDVPYHFWDTDGF